MPHASQSNPSASPASGRRVKHRARKPVQLIALYAAILLVIGGGTAAYGALSQKVTVSVEGQSSSVRTFGGTVGDLLDKQGVTLRDGDKVSMPLASKVDDGDTISVAYAKPVTVTVDGKQYNRTVTDLTVADALGTLKIKNADDAYVSVARTAKLPRNGMNFVVSTPKRVTLKADGKRKRVTSTAATVGDVLDEAGISVGADDEVRPSLDAFVKPSTNVRVVRIKKVSRVETVNLKHKVEVREDPDAMMGETEVIRPGRNGKARERVTLVYADGKLRKRTVHSTSALRQPVTQVVSRGTKREAPDSVWDKIAQCESGGNWSINTGNGYYGGLQFSAATWRSVGGPGLPHQHSREVQIKYAKILQARSGWGQWGCAHARFN